MIDTQVDGGFTLHRGHLREGRIELGATVTARVDAERRQGIRRAHSATHLLHYALQKHLGKHALQQGSKVDDDLLRFDFANPVGRQRRGADPHRERGERARFWRASRSAAPNMPLAEARKAGAMMLFGEKYPDVVRMVSIGEFSKELCGGTHLDNTGQVGHVQDHRRGERGGRHAADHGPDRPRRAGATSASVQTTLAPRGRPCCKSRPTKCPSGSRRWSRKSAN